MNHPEHYYSDSEYSEMWHMDCEQECCGETWANNREGFKFGDVPSQGESIAIYRGESKPYKLEELFGGKFGFSGLLSERLYELLGENGSENTEVPDDIDDEFQKWLGGQIEINWFKIVNVEKIELTYAGDTWIHAKEGN